MDFDSFEAIRGGLVRASLSHAWPGGPLTFGGMGIAAAWLLCEARRA